MKNCRQPAELKIQVRFLLGAPFKTTRKRGFFVCQKNELVCRSFTIRPGAHHLKPRESVVFCAPRKRTCPPYPYNTAWGAPFKTTRKRGFLCAKNELVRCIRTIRPELKFKNTKSITLVLKNYWHLLKLFDSVQKLDGSSLHSMLSPLPKESSPGWISQPGERICLLNRGRNINKTSRINILSLFKHFSVFCYG